MFERIQQYIGSGFSLHLFIARTDDWKKKARAETSLREKIYNAFIQEGVSSGYAQHVVQLSNPIPNAAAKND
jgi:hypothetical protein